MILWTIILISLLQILIYIILDKLGYGKMKWLVFILIIAGNMFVLPELFSPKLPEGPKCGMPIMGVYLAFWIIGELSAITVHLVYALVAIKVKGK